MWEHFAQWFAGNAWYNSYWGSPAGLFTLVVILICCVGNILLDWVEDCLMDRLFFTVYALCCLTTLMHVYSHSEPYNIVKTLLFALSLHFLCKFIYRLKHRFCTGKDVIIHPGEHL